MKLTIGKTESGKAFELPIDAGTQTFAFIGRKGSGKTYAAGVFVEKLLKSDVQVIIIDTVGNWYGLRIAANGKDAGFDIPVIGGLRGDIPLQAGAGATIADVAVESGRSMILDLSQFSLADRQRFAAAFGERIWRKKKAEADPAPVHIVIEESQLIVPENVGRGIAAVMVGTYEEIIRLGRNYGIGVTMISQRPQSVNKEVLNQTECLFVLQVNGAHEREALRKWIVHQGLEKGLVDELPGLPVGTAYVWSPQWLRMLERVKVGEKTTFDSTATPKAGRKQKRRELKPLNLDDLEAKMKASIEEAKANDPKELRAEIGRLKAQLAAKPEAKADPAAIERAVATAVQRERQSITAEYGRREQQFRAAIATQQNRMSKAREALELNGFEVPEPIELSGRPIPKISSQASRGDERYKLRPAASKPSPPPDSDIGKGEFAVLTAIAQHGADGVDREQITVLTHYKRSTRDAYIQRLAGRGLIEIGKTITATADGMAALGTDFEPLPTGDELRHHWIEKLPEGESKVLAVAIGAYPHGVGRDFIGDQTGYKRSTRDAYIQRLATRKLVKVERGEVVASEHLFG